MPSRFLYSCHRCDSQDGESARGAGWTSGFGSGFGVSMGFDGSTALGVDNQCINQLRPIMIYLVVLLGSESQVVHE